MTLTEKFLAADEKVSEIEARNFEVYNPETDRYETSKEYTEALEDAQKLYAELEKQGINPFK